MIVTILTAGILAATVSVVWWLFRDESNHTRLMVAVLVAGALGLRLIYPTDYPPGYNPDEIQHCRSAVYLRQMDNPVGPTASGNPALSVTLFCVPLLPYLPPRLAIRGASMVAGSLSVALLFTLCRAMQLDLTASLTAAALAAVLPWSLFFGRVSMSGEIPFAEAVVLTMLARLTWRDRAGWREALCGAGAIAYGLYNYFAADMLLAIPLALAPLLPTWRRRAWTVAMVAASAVLWVPWWRVSIHQWGVFHTALGIPDPNSPPTNALAPGLFVDPVNVMAARTWMLLRCLVEPVAQFYIWTQPAVMVHPPVVLLAAAWGLVRTGWRRLYFLVASAGIGALPGLVSWSGGTVSAHRAILALPLVSVAAACGVQGIPWRPLRIGVALAVVAVATVESLMFFFSPAFWPRAADAFPYQ
jgi:hypothetical protein